MSSTPRRKSDLSEASQESKRASEFTLDQVEIHLKTPHYPELDNIQSRTAYPGTVSYKFMLTDRLPNVPNLLIQLIKRIDSEVPPLVKLCYGQNKDSLTECDRILTTLIATKKDTELCDTIINSCRLSEVAHLIQLFFLRLENPPFVAPPLFCETVCGGGFFIHPRKIARKESLCSRVAKVTQECLAGLNIYQQATVSYFIQRCQRWCQAEVAYQLKQDYTISANNTYTEAIRFLSRMFADCFVGLPQAYVAARTMSGHCQPTLEMKREVFMTLVGAVGYHIWHGNSIDTLYIPGTQQPGTLSKIYSRPSSTETCLAKHSMHKVRSFNWI
ncbi:hypothetical protein T265_12006 [Opisthorchis viverrini]|uniref:Uncharacterized protein n=1 Tax=Opisthorchis viverrini TaxID=6198 RepID=A0A074YWQ1_OPIVI|nr:hypothetical protein T265_12006 [Opisthorchis viverrini]KER19103.1 hypothetical protein T265_12006 [Opisthorchis viverrini]